VRCVIDGEGGVGPQILKERELSEEIARQKGEWEEIG